MVVVEWLHRVECATAGAVTQKRGKQRIILQFIRLMSPPPLPPSPLDKYLAVHKPSSSLIRQSHGWPEFNL